MHAVILGVCWKAYLLNLEAEKLAEVRSLRDALTEVYEISNTLGSSRPDTRVIA
ncbi:MAG: hypothetical protein MK080_00210 [Opitutales bacterium]|nr:hypothetical protein [Opitutales bacterium]NRA28418.1 hypothetical protein [Opitutales bacterium]